MVDERATIEALVRKVVMRTLGATPAAASGRKRTLLDEATMRDTPIGAILQLTPDTLVTPLARQVAQERHITLQTAAAPPPHVAARTGARRVAIGADHGGYELKEALKNMLAADYEVIDCGTHSKDPVDYPDIAVAVAQRVATGDVWRGIVIDGAGIGSCMAANKIAGVRAAMCYDQATAVNSREHNNANVLTLGAGLIGPTLAQQIVKTWLGTEFGGGRHAARVAKIDALDGRRPAVAQPVSPASAATKTPPAY
ncbi:MAG: ribose 5-phosphate isomerase B [Candidatus Promineofilum sp.]|nr:ribose 5-phosphate isomerase B [Promineifilum sp.]